MQNSIRLLIFFIFFSGINLYSQHHESLTEEVNDIRETMHENEEAYHEEEFEVKNTIFHHIGNQDVYSIGSWNFPLPVILYAPGEGWSIFSSSKFGIGHHGNGHIAYQGYVLNEGSIFKIVDKSFNKGEYHVDKIENKLEDVNGKKKEVGYVTIEGKEYKLDARTTFDGGLLGGGITPFFDFSITKNVVFMFLVIILLLWTFISIAKSYKSREGLAPKGLQSFFEPIILFIRDEVAKPFIGHKYNKYLPFLLTVFFFILSLNLLGQVPFFGSANVSGNLSVTLVLALVTFFVVNLNGKKDYWEHIFWMPGAPWWVKLSVLSLVEFLGLFIKPFTLMLRLFANITAGHMVVLTFVSLIFIFGKAGVSVGGSMTGLALALPLSLFMMALELLVAFIQAFVFTMLAASYIGAAIEEHHH